MVFEKLVSKEFAEKVKFIAYRLSMNPDYIMTVMAFETGKTFSPSVRNPLSSATGLVQFISPTAIALGTTTAALAKMSALQQLDYVEKYFAMQKKIYGPLKTLVDTYLSVFYPAAIKKELGYQFSSSVTAVNKVFDGNKDGIMTKQDVANHIVDWRKKNDAFIVSPLIKQPIRTVVGAVKTVYGWEKTIANMTSAK